MPKILLFIFIPFLFVSCGPRNSAFTYFEKKDIETRGVQFTKKIDILKENEVDIIFMATYLNKIDMKISDTKNEVFLISTFFTNNEIQSIRENNYKFLLNGKEAIWIEKIEKNDERFKELMLKNYWGNYYLVKFDFLENIYNLNLELTNQTSSKAILNFEK